MLSTYFSGLLLGFSLILAIGAQNAFVLKQGLLKQYVFWVCLVCALSDAVLICFGVFGFASILSQQIWLIQAMKYFGAAFLLIYGLRSFYNAYKADTGLVASDQPTTTLVQTLILCLSFSWLNPHVYLDTVVLLGSISAQYLNKTAFAMGQFQHLLFSFLVWALALVCYGLFLLTLKLGKFLMCSLALLCLSLLLLC